MKTKPSGGFDANLNLAWSDYWSKGGISSFSGTNYEGVIKKHWLNVASIIKNQSNVIDLCTGNGALLDILSTRSDANFVGVDYAELNPPNNKNYTLIGQCSIDKLPYSDNYFSLAVSQYGFEYSDLHQSTKELHRVLGDQGEFKFICHLKDSVILRNNRHIFECSCQLIEQVFPVFAEMLRGLDLIAKNKAEGSSHASKNREKFNKLMEKVFNDFGDTIYDTGFPEAMKGILSQKDSGDTRSIFKEFEVAFSAAQQRLQHLFNVALDENKTSSLLQLLQESSFKLTTVEPIIETGVGEVGLIIEGLKVAL